MSQPGRRPPTRLTLGRVGGVPVHLSASWLLIAVVITVLFAPLATRSTGLGPGPAGYVVAAGLAVLLAVSVLAHETAHAVAARGFGLHVVEVVIDLWGGHTSLGRPQTPGASAVVSVVGPLVNLLLAGLTLALQRALPPAGPGTVAAVVGFLLLGTAVSNAFVGVFNLLPALPLDGGRVLEALVWRVTGDQDVGSLVAGWAGRAVAVAVVAWALLPALLRGERPGTFTVVWTVLIGVFLWRGASAAIRVAGFRRRAAGVDLAAITRHAAVAVAGTSLAEVTRLAEGTGPAGGPGDTILLDERGHPVAVVLGGSVADVPAHLRPTTPASALARVLLPGAVVQASDGALGAVEGLARGGDLGVVLVDADGRPTGRVLPEEFAAAMGLG